MGIKPSEKMANELHSEHCDFERYGTKCTCGTQALVDEVSQLEVKNAALRAELMSLKGAYYSANNKGWQLEFDNAALKRENEELKAELREERKRLLLELYNNSAISQFQFDIAMKELELLTTEGPTP